MAKYAEFCAYGYNTISDSDCLAQFDDAEQRDEFIERINSRIGYGNGEWVPVTIRDVCHAYNVRHFNDEHATELNGERQKNGHVIYIISHRPGFEF